MLKIFDCSNKYNRPVHREISLCPKENSIVADLKKYAYLYNFEFINNIRYADILFTNDVFPNKDICKIKRMDGIFQLNSLKNRNILLNKAAQIADGVIFISKFSRDSYFKLYGKLKNSTVILNSVDNFYRFKDRKLIFCASASNWARKEKRFDSLVRLFKNVPYNLNLIGKCDYDVPKNIIKYGYCNDNEINEILNNSGAFINLSYKDACPKVVSQAVCCELPVLYADSGGVSEQVKYGVKIKDNKKIGFENYIPDLNELEVLSKFNLFIRKWPDLCKKIQKINHNETIKNYFNFIRRIYETRRNRILYFRR